MESKKKANKKWKDKNKEKIIQYKFEFFPKDHDLVNRLKNIPGKSRNEKLRFLLDSFEEKIINDYELKQDNE